MSDKLFTGEVKAPERVPMTKEQSLEYRQELMDIWRRTLAYRIIPEMGEQEILGQLEAIAVATNNVVIKLNQHRGTGTGGSQEFLYSIKYIIDRKVHEILEAYLTTSPTPERLR